MILERLLPALDMKADTESVDDQRGLGSCVAHAGQTAIELMFKRAGKPVDLSRMYLYYYVQKDAGTLGTVDGGNPASLGAIINTFGLCNEKTWPYVEGQLGQEPSGAALAEGKQLFPSDVEYTSCGGVPEIKRALNQGKPVVIAMKLHDGVNGLGNDWRKHEWDTSTPVLFHHAATVIGYDDGAQRLLIENSYGPSWADGGFFGMPYGYLPEIVTGSWAFDKLPVPAIPFDGYVPDSIPEFDFDTKILSIPKISFLRNSFTPPTDYKAVRLKFKDVGNLTVADPKVMQLGAYFNKAPFMQEGKHLGFSKLVFRGTTYDKVLFVNADFDILSAEPC